MSHYGYGYGPPQGFQPPQAFPYQPQQFFPFASYPPTETADSYQAGLGQALEEYNHGGIPGLGLSNSVASQHGLVVNPPGLLSQPSQSVTDGRVSNQGRMADDSMHRTQNNPASVSRDEDAMEEGELSEGELEDIYEPGGMEGSIPDPRHPPAIDDSSKIAAHGGSAGPNIHRPAEPDSREHIISQPSRPPLETSHRAREHSGSYSPYLSPREILSDGQSHPAPDADDSTQIYSRLGGETNTSIHPTKMAGSGGNGRLASPQNLANAPLAEARQQAQEAIRRLWPLNIRFQNYVDEGIDKAILNDLFVDLGLGSDATMQNREQGVDNVQPQSNPPPHISEQNNDQQAPRTTLETAEKPEKAKDKAEERKDRIARLLAAKGSKASVGTSLPNNTKPASTTQAAPMPNKIQSEKSELLQQKLEALRKAREESAKKAAQEQETVTSIADIAAPQPPTVPVMSTSNGTSHGTSHGTPGNEVPGSVEHRSRPPSPAERVDAQATQPIPGLFLSSTPQPINPRKRPVAADLNEALSANSHKRPFGQIRESRPFLIDVSDDEDDAEMEIDSPEQRSPVNQPATPAVRTSSFRDHPALSDNGASRHCSSPSAMATPTGPVIHTNSLYDLESMNKKIEDMKRKIAEAEARKKAKQSQNGTPSLPLSQVQSKEGSVDPLSNTRPPLARAETADNRSSTTLPLTSQDTTINLPKGPRRSQHPNPHARSRVASERLPLLEARRRSQMAQLRDLQSEVARIEKEIQDSLVEEKRLREEAQSTESDSDEGQLPPRSESVPGRNSLESITLATAPTLQDTSTHSPEKPYVQVSTSTLTAPLIPAEAISGNVATDDTNLYDSSDSSAQKQRSDSTSSAQIEIDESEAMDGQEMDETSEDDTHEVSDTNAAGATNAVDESRESSAVVGVDREDLPSASDGDLDLDQDVAMEEADDFTSSDGATESSDDYEPAEPEVEQPRERSPSLGQSPPKESVVLETDEIDGPDVSTATPVTELISVAKEDSVPGPSREVDTVQVTNPPEPRSGFVPYETPLRYFHAYRFHPNFEESVSGGLRSLTYSNLIDVKQQVCPDQLLGAECPRGSECGFQHFEQMQAPDDQILLQLGAYGNYEEEQKQRYISGLRDLLTDFRNRGIRDFQSISQGIIDYRAQFRGDKTKVLPLGNVSI